MKKKVIIIILIVAFLLALLGINIFLNIKKDTNNIAKQEEMKVVEVTSQTFEEEVLKSEKVVFIDFYATWCGPCKVLAPIIEELAKENEDIKFVEIDINEAEDIAEQYQIMSIPTLVLLQNGEEKDRMIGYVDKSQILDFIKGKE